jgi:hypothetical protein
VIWKLGLLQSVYNELWFYVEIASPDAQLFEILLFDISMTSMVERISEAMLLDDYCVMQKLIEHIACTMHDLFA